MVEAEEVAAGSQPVEEVEEEIQVQKESKLGKKDHWDDWYVMELRNFEDNGDDGEVWYGKDVQKKTVQYIMDQYCADNANRDSLHILDVGTGNGQLLFKLAKKGMFSKAADVQMKGIDYSENSITFVKQI